MSFSKAEQAMQLHSKGFNCAQSVALPFCEEFGLDPKTVMMGMEGFGAGMGGRELTCGALSGAIYMLGFKCSDGNLDSPATKTHTYAAANALGKQFSEKCGSAICREIKGEKDGKALMSCNDCIILAVNLLEEALNK